MINYIKLYWTGVGITIHLGSFKIMDDDPLKDTLSLVCPFDMIGCGYDHAKGY